jgi:hypothetical protein
MITRRLPLHATRTRRLLLPAVLIAGALGCSPGTLPGSPSPVLVGGGGARYNGSLTVRRVGGSYAITEAAQSFTLSLVMQSVEQITGRFDAGAGIGSLTGTLDGSLASGTFEATLLVNTPAQQGSTALTCEGRGSITGTLSGVNLSWSGSSITYDNCPGLTTSAQAQAVAVSPIPGTPGAAVDRANLVISIVGGTRVPPGPCLGGLTGFPFTVEMAEMAGIDLTFDSTFVVEERRNFGGVSTTTLDMPFTDLDGGSRRTYGACSLVPGTYQAFFTGTDANGNRIRVASPIVTLGG